MTENKVNYESKNTKKIHSFNKRRKFVSQNISKMID